jgi:hypothetical protein
MLRIIGGIVAGLVTAVAVMMLIEMAGHAAFPLPEDLGLRNPEAVADPLPSMPVAAKLIVVFAWFAGALAGGYVAKRICGRWSAAWAIAVLVAVAGIVNIMMIPHPVWMQIAAIVAPLVGGLVAGHLIPSRKEPVDARP